MLLNSCHLEYYGYGVSPVDATLGVISGRRPYGGVDFLWKKCLYMGDSLEKGTKTVTRSSVAMRTPETIACFTRPQLSGISVKLVQRDQIYESPTLNKTLGTYLNGYNNHRHYIFCEICI